METATSGPRSSTRSESAFEPESLIDYCSRPSCRKEFRRATRPGRPQEYCSELCRRAAEKELRRARSRLAHYEGVVQKLRIDVAAHGKPDSDEDGGDESPLSLDARQRAESAVLRAGGVLRFANPDDLAVQELQKLYKAVAPIVLSDSVAR